MVGKSLTNLQPASRYNSVLVAYQVADRFYTESFDLVMITGGMLIRLGNLMNLYECLS